MLNNDQIKLVQTAVRKAGIRTAKFDGRYRMLLSQYLQPDGSAVRSCKQLNNSQMTDFLAICEASGFRQPGKSETYYRDKASQESEYASFAQQKAIGYLSEDLGMTTLHLKNFITYMTGREQGIIALITSKEAGKIIEALKAILGRKKGIKFDSLQSTKEYFEKGATDGKEQNQIG